MSSARVESIDALRAFRAALVKFAEFASTAIGHAESEVDRTLIWLEGEQKAHWEGQVRKRTEWMMRAKLALQDKKLYKTFDGRPQPATEEEQAYHAAVRRLDEANEKRENVRRYVRILHKQSLLFKGHIQRLNTIIQTEMPTAAAHLDQLAAVLEAYVAAGRPGEPAADGQAQPVDDAASMRRPEPVTETPPQDPPPSADKQ
jgi:hypothetical protein